MNSTWLAGGVFLITYALIVTERVHRTVSALMGGMAMILLGVFSQDRAFQAIDWNVIFLLAGMMIIANVLRETGFFQWIAVQAVKLGRGDPFAILVILSVITAVSSALLDNVTVVILVAPVTLFVAGRLHMSPVPFLVAEILASNIGGMATLIGDPPNILIGSAADIDFLAFSANLAPIAFLILLAFVGLTKILFQRDLKRAQKQAVDLASLESSALITDRILLRRALIVVSGVVLGFLLHGALNLEPATIAMGGATVLLLWSRKNPQPLLQEIEWTSLFFFMGLFITVEALVQVGIIESVAQGLLGLTGSNLNLLATLLLWFSAVASGIVDNIPYTAAVIPLIETIGQTLPIEPLWWALALGACLGGNATLVGASANVVVADIARRSGHPIRFAEFLVYGLITTIMSLVMATAYLWLRYL